VNTARPVPSAAELQGVADLTRHSDEELMVRLKAGCGDALAVLFERYHRLVLSVALRIVRDPGEAEDVLQNVFLEIFRAVGQFDPAKGSSRVWILQYAYHRAINRRQYLNTRHFYTQEDISNFVPLLAGRSSAFADFNAQEWRVLLQQGLESLPTAQRRVIELASHEGLSMKEIAGTTGESLSNVRHHYYRGLEKLRSFMARTPEVAKAAGAGD
jgi:RNA polymerase sigma-70 factor (ECF subfamily)